MKESGNIGGSPVVQSVEIDAALNLSISLSYVDPIGGASISIMAKQPLEGVLDAAAAKLNSPIASEIEKGLVAAIKLYLAQQPPVPPPAPAA